MTAENERESERVARRAIEEALGMTLIREAPRSIPWVDYSSGASGHGFEVKAVTSEEFRRLSHQIHNEPSFASRRLARHWSVLIDVPTMYDKFQPVPDFPVDPDEATIKQFADAGLIIQRREDRTAEWNAQFSGDPTWVPQIRGLGCRLEPDFAVLEAAGIENTRGAMALSSETMRALQRVRAATHDAICMSRAPFSEERLGIEILFSYGYVRQGANALAERVEGWLVSRLSSNLRQSLSSGAWRRRHAVLVFDSSEPEFVTAQDEGAAFVPDIAIRIPKCVDELWCVLGVNTLTFTPERGWRQVRRRAA